MSPRAWFGAAVVLVCAALVVRPPQAVAQPRLTIASDSTCPSQEGVAQALAALCPPADWPTGSVVIRSEGEEVIVEITGEISTRRRVRLAGDCLMRATTVAVVIATWTGELSSNPAASPVLRGQAAKNDLPALQLPLPSTVAHATQLAIGAGVLLSESGGMAPGFRADFEQTRRPRGLGWQAGLTMAARRELASAAGPLVWTRASADVAIHARTTSRSLAVSVGAGLVGGYTFASGHGYDVNRGARALDAGLVAHLRLGRQLWRLNLWADLGAYRWLFPQTIAVDSTTGDRVATVELPSSDVQLTIGLAYLLR